MNTTPQTHADLNMLFGMFVVVCFGLGASLIFYKGILNGSGFKVADQVFDLSFHGAIFLAFGLWLLIGWHTGKTLLACLVGLGGWFAFWSLLFLWAAIWFKGATTGIFSYGGLSTVAFYLAVRVALTREET